MNYATRPGGSEGSWRDVALKNSNGTELIIRSDPPGGGWPTGRGDEIDTTGITWISRPLRSPPFPSPPFPSLLFLSVPAPVFFLSALLILVKSSSDAAPGPGHAGTSSVVFPQSGQRAVLRVFNLSKEFSSGLAHSLRDRISSRSVSNSIPLD